MPPTRTAIEIAVSTDAQPLLSVRDLRVSFALDEGLVRAVDGTSFDVMPGQVLGVVGESGCGKSVTMRAILQLVERPGRITTGEIHFRRDERRRRPRAAAAARAGDARHPRRRDRADPAGADGGLQPGAHGGRPDRRGDPAAQPSLAADGRKLSRARRATSRSACSATSASRCPSSASTPIPGSSRAACASAP